MEGKPENVIEYKKYIEPHTFENDREAVLFYSYIEAHEHISTLHSELEKARELISELISKRDSRFMHDVVVKAGAFLNEGKK